MLELGSTEIKKVRESLKALGSNFINEDLMRTIEKKFGDLWIEFCTAEAKHFVAESLKPEEPD